MILSQVQGDFFNIDEDEVEKTRLREDEEDKE